MTVWEVAVDLIRHPRVIDRWHWKSATLSAIIRGSLFFATNLADGPRLAGRATLVEFALRVPLLPDRWRHSHVLRRQAGMVSASAPAPLRADHSWQASSRRALTPSVTLVEARGIGVTRGHEGYRLFLDIVHIRAMVRECRPDVLEAGDPWISGPLALWLRRKDGTARTVSSFFHSDPIPAHDRSRPVRSCAR